MNTGDYSRSNIHAPSFEHERKTCALEDTLWGMAAFFNSLTTLTLMIIVISITQHINNLGDSFILSSETTTILMVVSVVLGIYRMTKFGFAFLTAYRIEPHAITKARLLNHLDFNTLRLAMKSESDLSSGLDLFYDLGG